MSSILYGFDQLANYTKVDDFELRVLHERGDLVSIRSTFADGEYIFDKRDATLWARRYHRCGADSTDVEDYWSNSDVHGYDERERLKKEAYLKLGTTDPFQNLKIFELISHEWFARVPRGIRPDLSKYRKHLVRAHLLVGSKISAEILETYPPASGKWFILPGGSDWKRGGVQEAEADRWFWRRWAEAGKPDALPERMPTSLRQYWRKTAGK